VGRAAYVLANALAGLALVLIVLDPSRPLWQIIVPVGAPALCAIWPRLTRWPPAG
jgi:hypothetical protein